MVLLYLLHGRGTKYVESYSYKCIYVALCIMYIYIPGLIYHVHLPGLMYEREMSFN